MTMTRNAYVRTPSYYQNRRRKQKKCQRKTKMSWKRRQTIYRSHLVSSSLNNFSEHYLDQRLHEDESKEQFKSRFYSEWRTKLRHHWRIAGVCWEPMIIGLPSTLGTYGTLSTKSWTDKDGRKYQVSKLGYVATSCVGMLRKISSVARVRSSVETMNWLEWAVS